MSGSTYWTHRDWDYSLSYGGHRDDDKGYGHYTPYADGWFA